MKLFSTEKLAEICRRDGGRIQTGPFGSQLHQADYQAEGVPVVMPQDIIRGGNISIAKIARISEQMANRLKRHRMRPGDIIFPRRGDVGKCALITEREAGWLCGTGCLLVRLPETSIQRSFLYYYLNQPSIISWIEMQAVGATMPNLNTGILGNLPIAFPPLPEQQRIGGLLAAYDDLIRTNTERQQVLEALARQLYQEWFVRLRFPGHEQVPLVNGLPQGWELKKLGEAMELAYGKALKDEGRVPGPFPVYGSSGVVGSHKKALVEGPGIIVGRKGNVGSVFWSFESFFPIDTVYFVRSPISLYYLFFNLKQQHFINGDSAVPGLSRGQAYNNDLLVPSAEMLEEFDKVVGPIFVQLRNLTDINIHLRQTRDALLPRLLSGQLPLPA